MSEDINFKLYEAAEDGRYDEVAAYISRGADPTWTNGSIYVRTALHRAAWNGHVRVAGLLLDHGWNLKARNSVGWQPFHSAAAGGHVEVMQLLSARGAVINSQDRDKWTPLHEAAHRGHAAAVQLLLSLGADRTIKDEDGETAAEVARGGARSAFKTEIETDTGTVSPSKRTYKGSVLRKLLKRN